MAAADWLQVLFFFGVFFLLEGGRIKSDKCEGKHGEEVWGFKSKIIITKVTLPVEVMEQFISIVQSKHKAAENSRL